MEYLPWVVLALAAYSGVGPLGNVAGREMPSEVVVLLSTAVMLVITAGVMLVAGTARPAALLEAPVAYVYLAGVFLAVGALAYFRALATGPVSVVVPIFGTFIVMSSLLGFVLLGEAVSARKLAGIAIAVLAIYLTSSDRREPTSDEPT